MKLACVAFLSVAVLGLAACEPTPEQNTASGEKAAKEAEASPDEVGVESLGELVVANGWARETPEGAEVGGGFVTIVNGMHNGDTLIGARANFADMVQIHRSSEVDGVARMEQIRDGLPIPSGATLKLRPGGLHLMFMGLKEPLESGDVKLVTLEFRRAGEKKVPLIVRSMAEDEAGEDHSGHDMTDEGQDDHGGA